MYSGADVLSETYSPDAWGNTQESGNFNFTQSLGTSNQVSGYSYDGAGDLLSDGINSYTWNVDGTLASTESAQYTYDALEQRVEKTGGSGPGEFIYFNGIPIAVLSGGSWTDLIWAGKSMIGEVDGTESALPDYRLLDNEGSLIGLTDSSGTMTGPVVYAPYGQVMSNPTSDSFDYVGLYQDTEYGGDHAWYRSLSTEQIRWLSPDPYNGSYNLMDPQSLSRYSYVDDSPLSATDPSGLTIGILTGIGGGTCSQLGLTYGVGLGYIKFNPCDPVASIASMVVEATISSFAKDVMNGSEGVSIPMGNMSQSEVAAISGSVNFVITLGCSIAKDPSQALCGPKGWTSLLPGDYGKIVGDSIAAVGGILGGLCATGTGCPALIGYLVYQGITNLLAELGLFEGPQFHGTLIPWAADLDGLGTAPIGIPNGNLTVKMLLQQSTKSPVTSPGMMIR